VQGPGTATRTCTAWPHAARAPGHTCHGVLIGRPALGAAFLPEGDLVAEQIIGRQPPRDAPHQA
jgi:hypothetical protein